MPKSPDVSESRFAFIQGHQMQAAQSKWERLTPEDLSQVMDLDQLIDRVSGRYSLPRAQACKDVVMWVTGSQS